MQPKGDVTLVFVEPATPVVQDLQYRQLIPQEYDVRGRGGDILRSSTA
jgi:hypothetical protein